MSLSDLFRSPSKKLENSVKQVFANPPVLETPRLILKKIVPENARDMYAYASDPDITKYLTWSCHSSLKETERYIKLLQKKYDAGVFNDWGVTLKENGRFIGTCGYTSFDFDERKAEIGYVIAKDCHGHGYAPEAARRIMKFGAETFGLVGYFAKMIEGNDASMSVMKKCGMVFDGVYKNSMYIKGEYKTIIVFKTPDGKLDEILADQK